MPEAEFSVPEPKKVVEVPEEIEEEFEGDAGEAPPLDEAPPCLEVTLGANTIPEESVEVYHEINPDPASLLQGMLARGGDDGALFRDSQITLHNANITAKNIERRAKKALAKKKREEGGRRR